MDGQRVQDWWRVRIPAINGLADIGAEAAGGLSALRMALRDPRPDVRLAAARAMLRIGEPIELKKWTPALLDAVAGNYDKLRGEVHKRLEELGGDKGAAADALEDLLKRTDFDFQDWAIHCFKRLGAKAKAAVPELLKLCKDREATVRGAAINAGAWVDPENNLVMGAALTALDDADDKVRVYAAARLTEMRLRASAMPALIDVLKDSNGLVRSHAATCLGNMGPEARAAVPALREMVGRDRDASPATHSALQSIERKRQ
jgi:HEAT repeat protein